MWITNIPGYYLPTAFHPDPGENSILIQIADPEYPGAIMPANDFPIPLFPFKEQYRFRFFDMTDDHIDKLSPELQEGYKAGLFNDGQALAIACILIDAYAKEANVIVHCSAGICRSGAITEVGVMMGFEDLGSPRIPNLLVKRKLVQQLYHVGFF